MGYMHMLDKTAGTIDDDGLLHIGADVDKDITDGSDNAPPVLIENEVKAAMVVVSNCMLIGSKRKFLISSSYRH